MLVVTPDWQSVLAATDNLPDPIWLRTLATVLPVAGSIIVAILGVPKLIEMRDQRRAEKADPASKPAPLQGPGVPDQVAVAATERASADPIIRLFIEDLHERLSAAHEEAAELHTQRAVDAGTIARLAAEIADKEERLQECEVDIANFRTQNRALIGRLEELKREIEVTRRKLTICMEGYQSPHDRSHTRSAAELADVESPLPDGDSGTAD